LIYALDKIFYIWFLKIKKSHSKLLYTCFVLFLLNLIFNAKPLYDSNGINWEVEADPKVYYELVNSLDKEI